MQNHLKVCDDMDVAALRLSLVRQPHLFDRHAARKYNDSPHHHMTDIWVRYNDIKNLASPATFNDEHDSVWYDESIYIPEVFPVVFRLMSIVKGERLGGVLITKIPPGGKIAPHIDEGWHAEYYDKYFVPIQSDEGCIFGFEDGVIDARPGEVHWFRNDNPHWVENNSKRDRIVMIVCIRSKR